MRRLHFYAAAVAGLPLTMFAAPALAAGLTDLPMGELRSALDANYDFALAATQDPAIKRSTDGRYIWAVEAKNQCGIAIGFTKSRTNDAESIRKCELATAQLKAPPLPPLPARAAPLPPPPSVAQCMQAPSVIVFFDWDVDVPGPEARGTVQQLLDARAVCGWSRFNVTGYTDTSGSRGYNDGLSMRRARNAASLLESGGFPATALSITGRGETDLKVETADGVREAQNRRVEIVASGAN